jgi:hypothetical protein
MNEAVLLPQPLLHHQARFADALGHFVQPNVQVAYEIRLIKNTVDALRSQLFRLYVVMSPICF